MGVEGIPIRIEVGPKDVESGKFVVKLRIEKEN